MVFTQRDLMRKLYAEHGGHRESVIAAYAEADERGEVRRSRNTGGTPSREYAIRLWANGMYMGWLGDGKSIKRPREEGAKKATNDAVTLFEEPLELMGRAWRDDPSRPSPSDADLDYWSALIKTWCADPAMPLLVRKGGHRAIIGELPNGRTFVRCDNSPAHWAFMGCHAGHRPTLQDVRDQLVAGDLPIAMARTRPEKALIAAGTHTSYGGFIGKSKYGQVNKFTDGRAFKLCHLQGVGLGSRGEVEEFDEMALREHMQRLLDPLNMVLVPLRYSGVGECQAFLDAFMP